MRSTIAALGIILDLCWARGSFSAAAFSADAKKRNAKYVIEAVSAVPQGGCVLNSLRR